MQKWYTNKVLLNTLIFIMVVGFIGYLLPSPQIKQLGAYHLLSCGNIGYDQGCCENHDGHAKNRKVIQR